MNLYVINLLKEYSQRGVIFILLNIFTPVGVFATTVLTDTHTQRTQYIPDNLQPRIRQFWNVCPACTSAQMISQSCVLNLISTRLSTSSPYFASDTLFIHKLISFVPKVHRTKIPTYFKLILYYIIFFY